VSRRLQIVVPDPVAEQLNELAGASGQPPSTLAGQMVRSEVAAAAKDGRIRPLRSTVPALADRARGGRPQWLQPPGGDRDWRAQMWGAVVTLHGRYPRLLGTLKDEWWTDTAHTETLCALAVWRAEIDDAGDDPREELAFHAQLADYAQVLRQQGGGVAKAWKPGAPPDEWAA
jgi:hypothetical protein